ncbi:hypothetical protein ACVWWO_006463 [Bradyrhizobium sp. F1.13.1]
MRNFRLILVHGTWGRGFFRKSKPEIVASEYRDFYLWSDPKLRWFEPGSYFRQNLACALDKEKINATVEVLLWDGANSFVSRSEAASALANRLKEAVVEFPREPVIVIAHSHGGNIALRAAHILDQPLTDEIRIITLATPFVQVRALPFGGPNMPFTPNVIRFLRVAVTGTLGLMLGALGIYSLTFLPVFNDPPWGLIFSLLVLASSFYLAYRAAKLLIKWIINPPIADRRYDSSKGFDGNDWAYKPEILEALSSYTVPQAKEDLLLVLRGIDDEASLTLAAGAIGNRAAQLAIGYVLPNLSNIFFAIGLAIFGLAVSQIADIASTLLMWAIATLALFVPGCFRSVFGRELVTGSWRCEVSADSAPDANKGVRVLTLTGSRRYDKTLRHALYKHPEVVPAIVSWLTQPSSCSSKSHGNH